MRRFLATLSLLLSMSFWGWKVEAQTHLGNLSVTKNDPVYATYAADREAAEFAVDEGYQFVFYRGGEPLKFTTDTAGELFCAWKSAGRLVMSLSEMYRAPTITKNYHNLVAFHYQPIPDLEVKEDFVVPTSRLAIRHLKMTNVGSSPRTFQLYLLFNHNTGVAKTPAFLRAENAFTFTHFEPADGWTKDHEVRYVENYNDVYLLSEKPNYYAGYPSLTEFFRDAGDDSLSNKMPAGDLQVLAFQKKYTLGPDQSVEIRIIRGVQAAYENLQNFVRDCQALRTTSLAPYADKNETLYNRVPQLQFTNPDEELMYWSGFQLIRQMMLPPENETSYNYYVFSREPTWGWGHGGQVFHESLSMLAYVFLDPQGAMDSQRVFMERQRRYNDGYIPYRLGPYLNETIPYAGKLTTSAPWFSWENWEIFKVTHDRTFLQEAYVAGEKFYNFWLQQRDVDQDGLCEWGAHAVLECVRDGRVAVWDKVGWPSNFEALDLNCMLVMEAKSLAEMARALGDTAGVQKWIAEASQKTQLINQYMWDATDGFYYHVDRRDHDFTFSKINDLKRQEIIGFLPLWAGVASNEQAAALLDKLLDPSKFWRKYGVPSLAADDSYYNHAGYWNGPVWVEWNYLIFRGLLNYGYRKEAEELARKVFDNVIDQLKTEHWFWELYSPDMRWAGHNKAYIWSGLVSRMLIDLQPTTGVGKPEGTFVPRKFELRQNYPNPFSSETKIEFALPKATHVLLTLYNYYGQQITTLFDANLSAGHTDKFYPLVLIYPLASCF